MKNLILITIASCLAFSGCSTINDFLVKEEVLLCDAATVGALAYINDNPAKAQKLSDYVAKLRAAYNEDGTINVVEIQKLLTMEFEELEPYQVLVIRAALVRIVSELEAREVDTTSQVDLDNLLSCVEVAALAYLTSSN